MRDGRAAATFDGRCEARRGAERGGAVLAAAFAALLASTVARVVWFEPLHAHRVGALACLGAGGAAWALAIVTGSKARTGAGWVVLGAVVLRGVALAGAPETSDDAYRYVWEGALLLDGTSPYAFAPDAPELAAERARRAAVHEGLNNPQVSAAYPPLAQATMAGLVAAAGGAESAQAALRVQRAGFALLDLLCLAPLAVLCRRRGRPAAALVAWGWSPLVVLEFAGAGHLDSLGILLLLAALALLVRDGAPGRARELLGRLALAGGVLAKLLPALALPFVARAAPGAGAGARRALAVLVLVAIGFLPVGLLEGGWRGLAAGLGEYGLRWESTSLAYRWIEHALPERWERDRGLFDPRRVGRAIALALLAAVAAAHLVRRTEPVRATAALVGAFLVLTPTLHPWYVCWSVPFLALRPSAAWAWLAVAAPLAYWPLARWVAEGEWREPAWLWPALALPFAALWIAERLLRARGTAP